MNLILGLALPIVGASFLLYVGKRTESFVRYQLISLFGALALSGIAVASSNNESIIQLGNFSAPANNIIDAPYASFAIIALAITTLVVYLQIVKGKQIDRALFVKSLFLAIPLSIMNSLTEELIFRVTTVQVLTGATSALNIAIISGLLFGIPHYFGNPGKIPGVVMAGFLGVIAAQSIFDTGGIGWAWAMHFLQDIPIITMLLLTGAKKL